MSGMANRWLLAFVVTVACVFSGAADADTSKVLNLSNDGFRPTVLRRSELLKHGDPLQWEEIDLSSNEINEVDDNTFLGFDNLKKLSLADNSLSTIEDNWFKGSKLQTLNLSKNLLVAVRSDAFSGLTDLQELSLANLLRPLKPHTFDHTPHLKVLDMKNSYIMNDIFVNITIPSVEVLNLQSCRIRNITFLRLKNLPNLKKLDLQRNYLDHLNEGAFTGNTHLEEVDLRGNYLDDLRGHELEKAFSPGSKVVLHFDLNNDTCINCSGHACDSDLELQTFICQKYNDSTFQDTFEWKDTEKNIKVTLKAHPAKTE